MVKSIEAERLLIGESMEDISFSKSGDMDSSTCCRFTFLACTFLNSCISTVKKSLSVVLEVEFVKGARAL